MNFPKSFTTITPLSKTLALALFILLPVLGFYLGTQYKTASVTTIEETPSKSTQQTNSNKVPPENEYLTNDKAVFNFVSNTRLYNKASSSINFKCYDEYSLPTGPKITQLKEELAKKQRVINTVCTNTRDNKVLLVSADKIAGRDSNHNLLIELLDFYEPTQYTSEYLFQEAEQIDQRSFKLLDWSVNEDIIFWLQDNNLGRQLSYTIKTYVYNSKDFSSSTPTPKLVEYCDVGIAGGTSQRGIRSCKRFVESKSSLFFQQIDLP